MGCLKSFGTFHPTLFSVLKVVHHKNKLLDLLGFFLNVTLLVIIYSVFPNNQNLNTYFITR